LITIKIKKTRFGECLGVKPNGAVRNLVIFQEDLCSATSINKSQRELPIDVAEHGSILKNYHSTYLPRFDFTTKTGMEFLETNRFCFYWDVDEQGGIR